MLFVWTSKGANAWPLNPDKPIKFKIRATQTSRKQVKNGRDSMHNNGSDYVCKKDPQPFS